MHVSVDVHEKDMQHFLAFIFNRKGKTLIQERNRTRIDWCTFHEKWP
jgi:isopentenyldiphosphate isomerase